jgi:acetyl esterase/lipase
MFSFKGRADDERNLSKNDYKYINIMNIKILVNSLLAFAVCSNAMGCSKDDSEYEESTQNEEQPADDTTSAVIIGGIAAQDPMSSTIYLWDEGNMAHTTEYTGPQGNYQDPPSFRPYMKYIPAEGTVKGALLVCAGGAFMYRSDSNEGTPVAQWFANHGYQAFVVNYRVRPYTMQEGSLDLARAIRFVRCHAADYGIDPDNIASVGFSAGGILCGDEALHFDEKVNGTALDEDYKPDSLDSISANVCTIGMIYSFYGRLSYGTTDVELLRSGNLPPTFYAYGDRDPFYNQFLANAEAVKEAGVEVEQHEYSGMPHGFGYTLEDWMIKFDTWMQTIMEK